MSHPSAIGTALFVLAAASGVAAAGQAGAAQPRKPAASKTVAAPAPSAKAPATPAASAPDFQVQKVPAIRAVVLPMKGSYGQHPAAFERVDAFLSSHELSRAVPLFARYFSDPSVGEANLVW